MWEASSVLWGLWWALTLLSPIFMLCLRFLSNFLACSTTDSNKILMQDVSNTTAVVEGLCPLMKLHYSDIAIVEVLCIMYYRLCNVCAMQVMVCCLNHSEQFWHMHIAITAQNDPKWQVGLLHGMLWKFLMESVIMYMTPGSMRRECKGCT